MPYNRKAFGIVISRLRTARGITQDRFSAYAGIARSHLTTLENGKKWSDTTLSAGSRRRSVFLPLN